jgi:hypothetical protein
MPSGETPKEERRSRGGLYPPYSLANFPSGVYIPDAIRDLKPSFGVILRTRLTTRSCSSSNSFLERTEPFVSGIFVFVSIRLRSF